MINEIDFQSKIITVDKITQGPAASCYLTKKSINQNEPLFISSCDYLTIFNEQKFKQLTKKKGIDGVIWTYKLNDIIVKSFDSLDTVKLIKIT